jgi:hypothetical protein
MNRFTGRFGPYLAHIRIQGTGFRPMHALQLHMLRHFHIEIFITTRRTLRIHKDTCSSSGREILSPDCMHFLEQFCS